MIKKVINKMVEDNKKSQAMGMMGGMNPFGNNQSNQLREPTAEVVAEAASEEEAAPVTEEPAAADDLTKLTGIGKVGNEKLIDAGITTYAQIAKMSEEEAANFKVKAEAIAEAKELV